MSHNLNNRCLNDLNNRLTEKDKALEKSNFIKLWNGVIAPFGKNHAEIPEQVRENWRDIEEP